MIASRNVATKASDTCRLVRDDDIDDSELFGINKIRRGLRRVLPVSASDRASNNSVSSFTWLLK
jgi:hypothetical protein